MSTMMEDMKEAMSFFKFMGPPATKPGDGKVPFIVTGPRYPYKWYAKGDIDSFFALVRRAPRRAARLACRAARCHPPLGAPPPGAAQPPRLTP